MRFGVTREDVFSELSYIYNSDVLGTSIAHFLFSWLQNKKYSWDELLSSLFFVFVKFREYVDNSTGSEEVPESWNFSKWEEVLHEQQTQQKDWELQEIDAFMKYIGLLERLEQTNDEALEKLEYSDNLFCLNDLDELLDLQEIDMWTDQLKDQLKKDKQADQFIQELRSEWEEQGERKDIKEPSGYFLYPKWMCDFPIFDILKVNITWDLLLSARPFELDTGKTLKFLCNEYGSGQVTEPAGLSRNPVKDYPNIFKSFFGIKKEGKKYDIRPVFPKLFAVLVEHQNELPYKMRQTQKSRKWGEDIALYRSVLDVIAPGGKWTEDSYMAYILFEDLFHINTKMCLFGAEDKLKQEIRKGLLTLSPQLAAELFFSSLLIYMPNDYISSCLSSPVCLYSFIQTSFYYFPAIASMAKFYISQQNISTYEELEQYLFPTEKKGIKDGELEEWNNRYSNFIPSRFDNEELKRGVKRDHYQKKWCKFAPPGGYYNDKAYKLGPIAYWADRLRNRSDSDSDYHFLEDVCSNFPTELWKFSEDN